MSAVYVDFTNLTVTAKTLVAASSLPGPQPWITIGLMAMIFNTKNPKETIGKKGVADSWIPSQVKEVVEKVTVGVLNEMEKYASNFINTYKQGEKGLEPVSPSSIQKMQVRFLVKAAMIILKKESRAEWYTEFLKEFRHKQKLEHRRRLVYAHLPITAMTFNGGKVFGDS